MLLLLSAAAALAGPRPPASDTWLLVDDAALLCSQPHGQGQCARFRVPGVQPVDGDGPRVFRLVSRDGDQVQLQAQFDKELRDCGVLPSRLTPVLLRVWVDASAVSELPADAACVDPDALDEPSAGRDWELVADRVARVSPESAVTWLDGSTAGQLRRELWLWEEHGPTLQGDRVCATFDLGPDDGGAVGLRAFDLCFDSAHVKWDR